MKILERNLGPKIPYYINGTILDLDHRLMLNLSAYELDDENHIFIYQDRRGCLLCSADSESCYVAEIVIPARQYTSDRKAVYEGTLPVVVKTAVPFHMDNCTLALWALE
jgi:hypothetical protein